MKILAIDSSSMVATVGILDNEVMVAEYTVNYKKTHSQTLLPMIDEIVRMTDFDLNELDAIAISGGPGSFTGLRIGSATAKGLGLALSKPLIHIPTMDALAYNMCGTQRLICPLMDARRNQVYTGLYHIEDRELKVELPQSTYDIHEIIGMINQRGEDVVFLGDGVCAHKDTIEAETKIDYKFASAHMNMARAGAVGALAEIYYDLGKIENASEHTPDYLRKSQAERELEEKQKSLN